MKKEKREREKIINPLNLNSVSLTFAFNPQRFWPKYDNGLSPWDMALLGLLLIRIYANSSQQLIKHEAC